MASFLSSVRERAAPKRKHVFSSLGGKLSTLDAIGNPYPPGSLGPRPRPPSCLPRLRLGMRLKPNQVTLYIQMTLCPSDTLQDWLRKRNSRLSSEASGAEAGSGVLFEDDAHAARAPKSPPAAATAASAPPRVPDDDDANPRPPSPLPAVLLPEDLESGDLDTGGSGRGDKPDGSGSPMVSPRTDPVTSASSGADSSSSSSSDSGGGARDGALCPPPTRETSRKRERGEGAMQEAFETTAGEEAAVKSPATAMGSPARSVSSETVFCEGKGTGGTGTGTGSRVDLHEALRLFRQLAEGVSHIHSKGIIHRDIKVP